MVLTDEESACLDEIRERLLEAGIIGMPYLMPDGSCFIRVATLWRDSVSFTTSTIKTEEETS